MAASRSARLLDNAKAALISAIEIYNKPSFAYREETFAILALNAWELLLKAKLLEINGNKLKCLHIYSKRELAPGRMSIKEYAKRNRTGNKMTVTLEECIVRLEKAGTAVPEPVKKNLAALTEIRDNAVHFTNASPQLAKQVMEVGTACLRNFIGLGKQWLKLDLSDVSLYLMPIGFLPSGEAAAAITLSNQEQRVVTYLATRGMVHDGQRLPLGLETFQHVIVVHADFDEFQCDLSPHGSSLLCEPHLSHSAFAEFLHQFVITD
jgi:Protein of unknown function (DUF3644)